MPSSGEISFIGSRSLLYPYRDLLNSACCKVKPALVIVYCQQMTDTRGHTITHTHTHLQKNEMVLDPVPVVGLRPLPLQE